MIAERLIGVLGWILGKSPILLVQWLCHLLGAILWHLSDRRHSILSGLERTFPIKGAAWRERIGREHASRMFEMFLLILALPHWSERRQRERVQIGDSMRALIQGPAQNEPLIFMLPHSAMTEACLMMPHLIPNCPSITTLYRPLDFQAADSYIHRARETWGVKLVSRREGLLKVKQQLQSGHGIAGILFDQSAGIQGHLMLFLDRVCSTTNLPGLLAAKSGARTVLVRTRREGFWRGTMEAEILPKSQTAAGVMTHAHSALERVIRGNDNDCADWFWAHKRWKGALRAQQFLAFPDRKSYLKEQMELLGIDRLPQSTRVVVRLDPRPALLSLAHKLIHLIRHRRPDAQVWLLAQESLDESTLPSADRVLPLPSAKAARLAALKSLDAEFIDALIVLDPSREAAADARRLHCDLRVGVCLVGEKRNTYNRRSVVSDSEYVLNPLKAWLSLSKQMGMNEDIASDFLYAEASQTKRTPESPLT